MSDMAGGLGSRLGRSVVAVECGLRAEIQWSEWDEKHGRLSREVAVERSGSCRDTNRQSQIRSILFKDKDDQFRKRRLGQHSGKAECLNELERRIILRADLMLYVIHV